MEALTKLMSALSYINISGNFRHFERDGHYPKHTNLTIVTAKQINQAVVLSCMTQEERNTIISVWNDMVLRGRLEADPYSLSQDELVSLQSNDRLNKHIDTVSRNSVLLKTALKSYTSQA